MSTYDDDIRVVKMRGLPWTATKQDIISFFNDCKIYKQESGVHLVKNSDGRSSGEAFVEVPPDDDIDVFLRKDRKTIGHRYIEVFRVRRYEMESAMKRFRGSDDEDEEAYSSGRENGDGDDEESQRYVRLRGIPFEATKDDIEKFFQGLEISSGGIQIMMNNMGRPSGEALVEFDSKEMADKGRARDRECIGHRYVETFKVSSSELRTIKDSISRSSYYRGGSFGEHRHHPYDRGNSRSYRDSGRSRYDRHSSSSRHGRDFSSGSGSSGWGSRAPSFPGLKGSKIGASSKNCLLMRGLPYRADEYDIKKFFDPITPTGIDIIFDSNGRPSGTAKVQFASGDDVTRAMGKHKDRIDNRYIELFLVSTN